MHVARGNPMRDMPTHRRLAAGVLVGAAVVGVGIGSALALTRTRTPTFRPQPLTAQATWRAGARRAPEFRLRDQMGRVVSLASERGRVLLLTFLDSRCRQECPIEGRLLAQTERALGAASRSELVVVSVDPWADTARSARAFATKSGWTKWRWLFGTQAELQRVWKSYGVGVLRTPKDITHSAVLYVIDRDGFERAAYLMPFAPRDLAANVRSLLA